MKKLFAGIITCATILLTGILTGIGVSTAAADENNSGGENVKSEIVFVGAGFDECYVGNTNYPPESYKGIFVEKNGNIRSFSFEDVNEHWTFGYVSMEDIHKTVSLNKTTPQEKLLSHLTDVSKYQIVGKISEEELDRYLTLLSDINTNVDIEREFCPELVVRGYSETFGLRYDDNGNAEVVFLNGMGTIINNHTNENALKIDSWLRNLDISFDNPNTETTQPNPTENTTTTTTVTTTEVKPNTEQATELPTEVPKIEFCQVGFVLDYEEYYGIFLDSNRNVYSFGINNVTEDWNLYGDYSEEPIKLTDSMPQEGLLDYLYDHFDEWKLIGKTSEEDYADYKNELNQIDLNTEMAYRLYAEPDVVGLSHTETFAVRYDDNGDRQIVFLSGGLSIKYDHYLENPDEHAIALNSKMIKYEEISAPVTTPNEITDQTTTTPTTPDATTTTTVTTTITAETDTEQTTEPTTDAGDSVTTETSTVPPTTTVGTETTLPQTGYSKWYQVLVAAAMGMIGVGSTAIVKSGIFRKKKAILSDNLR